MDNFNLYAKYYNLIYKDKDYKRETEYCLGFIRKYTPGANHILNLGCGTGKHDFEFAEGNFHVTGIDISPLMIAMAKKEQSKLSGNKKRRVEFFEKDVRSFNSGKQYDVITSLFHVMSYQVSNSDVDAILDSARMNLKTGGLFIFDFWYGPAVLTEKPEVRIKEFLDKDLNVTRIASPVIHYDKNVVDVNYKLFIKEYAGQKISVINETHKMRYFFAPELQYWFKTKKFKVLHFCEWLKKTGPTEKSWSAVYILQKI